MADSVRISQQLSAGYNPDGTPGTVQTALQGPAGPPPTEDQVASAVAMYLMANPVDPMAMGVDTAPMTKHGAGAAGAAGAWVGVGDNGSTVSGYVMAGGSMPNVDLHLSAQGVGSVISDSPLVSPTVTVTGDLHIGGSLIFDDTIVGGIVAAEARLGLSSFDSSSYGGWFLANNRVALAPFGGANNDGSVSVYDPSTSGSSTVYWPVHASAFVVSSDRRLKTDITPLVGSLNEVRTTAAYSYVMNGQQRRGLIADEAPVALLREDNNGLQLLDLYDMVGTLWNAVRELAAQIGDEDERGTG